MTESRKILTAVAVGAAAGLVTGLLIAPDKGSATRQQIADTAKKMKDKVTDLTKSGITSVNSLKEKVFKKNGDVTSEAVL
ncbi:MAG: YtxH domain-containing protein [Chitinophagales bacterium]